MYCFFNAYYLVVLLFQCILPCCTVVSMHTTYFVLVFLCISPILYCCFISYLVFCIVVLFLWDLLCCCPCWSRRCTVLSILEGLLLFYYISIILYCHDSDVLHHLLTFLVFWSLLSICDLYLNVLMSVHINEMTFSNNLFWIEISATQMFESNGINFRLL